MVQVLPIDQSDQVNDQRERQEDKMDTKIINAENAPAAVDHIVMQ